MALDPRVASLIEEGYVVIPIDVHLPEEFIPIARRAASETGLVGFLDRFLVLLHEHQKATVQEERMLL